MPTRLPRWTSVLLLPVVVAALLLMHGLDARAGEAHPSFASPGVLEEEHPHDQATPGEHWHCVECLATHAMAACVAIVGAVGGLALVRRVAAPRRPAGAPGAVGRRPTALVRPAHPPDPAWVRLSVMRC